MASYDDDRRAEARVKRAHKYFVEGDLAAAERELRQAIRFDPDRGDWRYNLAMVLEMDGRPVEAHPEFVAAANALPSHIESVLGAGRCAAAQVRHEECLDWMQRAVKLDSKCESAHACIITALGMMDRDEEAEQAYFIAQHYLERYPFCLSAMGELLVKRGKLERAAWCFREAVQQNPSGPGLKTRLAEILQANGDNARAAKVFLQALRDHPGNEQTLLGYGSALLALGRAREAAEKYRRVVELNPANTRAHLMLAQIAVEAGRNEEARGEFAIAISLGDYPPGMRICSARCAIDCGDPLAAKAELEDELGRPDSAPRLTLLSKRPDAVLAASGVALECGAIGYALSLLGLAVHDDCTDGALLARLARAHFEAGDLAAGLRITRRHLKHDPGCAEALHNFALACVKMGRDRFALAALARARRECPSDREIKRLGRSLTVRAIRRGIVNLWRR
ncbi:MAG: tetratricopeptide repeat protein [Phycisphaerales bacterium]|nr:tetratricopeptide repeat protein [Phycisphaerales bacterium]